MFNSFDNDRLYYEVRYLSDGSVEAFIKDLMLGAMTNRYKAIFSAGTRVEFCIAKGNELYVGLSEDALRNVSGINDIKDGVALLRKNIVKNFTVFNKIHIYVAGELVSE